MKGCHSILHILGCLRLGYFAQSYNINNGNNILKKGEPFRGPVVIGGLGGSGTRVVAELLISLGYYLGNDLNSEKDNLWFTLLLKRREWFFKNSNRRNGKIGTSISLFKKILVENRPLNGKEIINILGAAITISINGHDLSGSGKGLWAFERVNKILCNRRIDTNSYCGWGWKEANSHIFLEYIAEHFASLRYIHVIRHGLDMAYSKNQHQLLNWGKLFGIDSLERNSIPLEKSALRYWIRSNRRVIDLGKLLLGQRSYILCFEKLCRNPEVEIIRLLQFLRLKVPNTDIITLAQLIKNSPSIGRYRNHDLSIFSSDEIEALDQFGYSVVN